MSDPLCVFAQLADGRTAIGVDRDGEGRVSFLISREDAAKLIEHSPEYASGIFLTLVPSYAVQQPAKRKRKGSE